MLLNANSEMWESAGSHSRRAADRYEAMAQAPIRLYRADKNSAVGRPAGAALIPELAAALAVPPRRPGNLAPYKSLPYNV